MHLKFKRVPLVRGAGAGRKTAGAIEWRRKITANELRRDFTSPDRPPANQKNTAEMEKAKIDEVLVHESTARISQPLVATSWNIWIAR
jgi:hypothetical protein